MTIEADNSAHNTEMERVVDLESVSVTYFNSKHHVTAVQNVCLSIERGEILGLAGESGSGKSTLVLALTRLLPPGAEITSGEIRFKGQNIRRMSEKELKPLRWAGFSLVSQSAMSGLNPVLTVGEQIVDAILSHEKVSRRQALERAKHLLGTVEVDPLRVQSFPHELSGGMRQRVMIAMALALKPDLIVMDEPTTALDVIVQAQIIRKIKQLQKEFGFSVLFITHDVSLLLSIADRIAVMYAGEIVEMGTSSELLNNSTHPYTRGLLNSFPSVFDKRELVGIPGSPPSMVNPPNGCRFHTRCEYKKDVCSLHVPQRFEHTETQWSACHLYEKG